MRRRSAIWAVLPLLIACASQAAAGSQLKTLFSAHPTVSPVHLCLAHHFDADHLAAHPRQNITDMLVYIGQRQGEQDGFVYYTVNAQLKFRDSRQRYTVSGECGRKVGEVAPIGCGIDCDGGGYELSLRTDGAVDWAITSALRLGEPDSDAPETTVGFQVDDTRLVLHQTGLNDCLPIINDEALKAGLLRGAVTQ